MGKDSKEQRAEKGKFKIEVVEHEKFQDIERARFLTAPELCKMISKMFRSAFADYEGCTTEKDQQGHLSVSLFFNHSEPKLAPDDLRAIAVSRDAIEDANIKNDIVRRVRANDNRVKNGDRYFLTDDGKSALEDFVYDSVFKKDGTVNWGRITAEVRINPESYNQAPIINTKISLLDPVKIVEKIFGKTDEEGTNWVYEVDVVSLPRSVISPQYQTEDMLAIKAVSEPEVIKLCNYAGLVPNNGINIIR